MDNYKDILNQFETKTDTIESICLGCFSYINNSTNEQTSLKVLLETDEYPNVFLDCKHPNISEILETITLNLLNEINLNQLDFTFIDFSFETTFDFDLKQNIPYSKKYLTNATEFENWIENQSKTIRKFKTSKLIHFNNYKEFNRKNTSEKIKNKIIFLNLSNIKIKQNHSDLLKQILKVGYKYGYIFILIFDYKNYKKALKKRAKNKPLKKVDYSKEILHTIDLLFEYGTPVIHYNEKTLIDNVKDYEFQNLFNEYFTFSISEYPIETVNKLKARVQEAFESSLEEKETILSVPIGTENGNEFHFELSEDNLCYHAFIAGATGMGKSNLIGQIIHQINLKYSSDEMRLSLLDLKGTDFDKFKKHPNVQIMHSYGIEGNIENANAFVQQIYNIIDKRRSLFNKVSADNIIEYNKVSKVKAQRTIVIIDEFQQLLFTKYKNYQFFNQFLDKITRQGRGFGIHLIIATQTLNDVSLRRSVLSNIKIRISYQLSNKGECAKILEEGNNAPQNLEKYQIVYNSDFGKKDKNHIVDTYFFNKDLYKNNLYENIIKEHKERFQNETEFEKDIRKGSENPNSLPNVQEIGDDFLFENGNELYECFVAPILEDMKFAPEIISPNDTLINQSSLNELKEDKLLFIKSVIESKEIRIMNYKHDTLNYKFNSLVKSDWFVSFSKNLDFIIENSCADFLINVSIFFKSVEVKSLKLINCYSNRFDLNSEEGKKLFQEKISRHKYKTDVVIEKIQKDEL